MRLNKREVKSKQKRQPRPLPCRSDYFFRTTTHFDGHAGRRSVRLVRRKSLHAAKQIPFEG